jgi:hypothetical protein
MNALSPIISQIDAPKNKLKENRFNSDVIKQEKSQKI